MNPHKDDHEGELVVHLNAVVTLFLLFTISVLVFRSELNQIAMNGSESHRVSILGYVGQMIVLRDECATFHMGQLADCVLNLFNRVGMLDHSWLRQVI